MSDSDSRSWISCLGWGCLVVVVVVILGIGGCVAFVYQGGKGAHGAAKAYLVAIEEQRYEDAHRALGASLAEQRSLEELIAFERGARAELGACEPWQARGTSFNREDGRTVSQLRFSSQCESGPATVLFNLEEIEGEWVIQDIRYNEPLEPAETLVRMCPECSGAIPPGAGFCPFCGRELTDEDSSSAVPPDEENGE